jgi:hypothetical protein
MDEYLFIPKSRPFVGKDKQEAIFVCPTKIRCCCAAEQCKQFFKTTKNPPIPKYRQALLMLDLVVWHLPEGSREQTRDCLQGLEYQFPGISVKYRCDSADHYNRSDH